ncbi:hypothetical protein G3M53_29300, partial [Streptomyces sp. SID7982]|nr:hypothetical protein [Streptomyces sp. SID7982]
DHDAEHPDAWTEPSAHAGPATTYGAPSTAYGPDSAHSSPHTSSPHTAAPAGQTPVTPADAADAARLVSFGLQPKLLPARDAEYADLLRRYREESAFARLADAVA